MDTERTPSETVDELERRLREAAAGEPGAAAQDLAAQLVHELSSGFHALLDASGRLIDVNPAALARGGLARGDVVGELLWETPWCATPSARTGTAEAVQVAAGGRFARRELALCLEAGGQAPATVDLAVRPLRGTDGRVAFLFADGQVVPERRPPEEPPRREGQPASPAYRDRLVAELTHDLRFPLQIILARAERFPREDPGAADEELRRIRLAAMHVLTQLEDLLDQMRTDHGAPTLAVVDGDLARTLEAVAAEFAPLAEQRGQRLEVHTPPALPARFDPEAIGRVLSNLIANGIRFADRLVRCSLVEAGTVARLEVADDGAGVPGEERRHVFEPWVQGEGVARPSGGGAGLGLAIVQDLVTLHGGAISVKKAPEGGALFTAELPLPVSPALARPRSLRQQIAAARRVEYARASAAPEPPRAGDPLGERPEVLVVDADAERAGWIAGALAAESVVSVAGDGQEAMGRVRSARPAALVICPLGESGQRELLERVRDDVLLTDVGRLALDGDGRPSSRAELLEAGAEDIVALPCTELELRTRVARLLDYVRLRRARSLGEAPRGKLATREVVLGEPRPPAPNG